MGVVNIWALGYLKGVPEGVHEHANEHQSILCATNTFHFCKGRDFGSLEVVEFPLDANLWPIHQNDTQAFFLSPWPNVLYGLVFHCRSDIS